MKAASKIAEGIGQQAARKMLMVERLLVAK